MRMVLRKAEQCDVAAVRNIVVRNWREVCARDYSPDVVAEQEAFYGEAEVTRYIAARYMLVAEDGGTPVGTGGVEPSDDAPGEYHIGGVFVLPEYQGCGVGKALMKELIRYATEAGGTAAKLFSTLGAVDFYRSLGFTVTEEKPYGYFMKKNLR